MKYYIKTNSKYDINFDYIINNYKHILIDSIDNPTIDIDLSLLNTNDIEVIRILAKYTEHIYTYELIYNRSIEMKNIEILTELSQNKYFTNHTSDLIRLHTLIGFNNYYYTILENVMKLNVLSIDDEMYLYSLNDIRIMRLLSDYSDYSTIKNKLSEINDNEICQNLVFNNTSYDFIDNIFNYNCEIYPANLSYLDFIQNRIVESKNKDLIKSITSYSHSFDVLMKILNLNDESIISELSELHDNNKISQQIIPKLSDETLSELFDSQLNLRALIILTKREAIIKYALENMDYIVFKALKYLNDEEINKLLVSHPKYKFYNYADCLPINQKFYLINFEDIRSSDNLCVACDINGEMKIIYDATDLETYINDEEYEKSDESNE